MWDELRLEVQPPSQHRLCPPCLGRKFPLEYYTADGRWGGPSVADKGVAS